MQIWLLKQRYRTYVDAIKFVTANPDVQGVVLDRSIYSDGTFAEQNFKDGNFTKEAYDYYKALVKQMMAKLPKPSLVLYLDVSAERCHERIMNMRKRECESGIPLPYLQGLDECHHEMVQRMTKSGIKVRSLEWKDFGTDGSMDDIAQEIKQSPAVQQSKVLLDFISDDNSVAQQSQLHEEDFNENETYLLDEQREVEALMVATVDPSALTEGEVDNPRDTIISKSHSNSSTSTPELNSPERKTKVVKQPSLSPAVTPTHVENIIEIITNPSTPTKKVANNNSSDIKSQRVIASPVSISDGAIFD